MHVREATPCEKLVVRRILDAAALETTALTARVEAGDVLVAVESRTETRDRVLGALVLDFRADDAHVEAIAVRRRRKGQGIGSTLVSSALERAGQSRASRLTATFDERVVPFYESLGFQVERIEGRRYRGVKTVCDR